MAYFSSVGNSELVVENVYVKTAIKRKPIPLRTVELQKFLTRYLKISSDKLMKIAEELYVKGFISYPRTETDTFEHSFDFNRILDVLKSDNDVGSHIETLLLSGIHKPRSGPHNDKSHPPIHPLKCGTSLVGDSKRVYDYILRRFVASCMEDAKATRTTVHFRLNDEIFKATSLEIVERNYLQVFTYDLWNETILPNFSTGDLISNWQGTLVESSVCPPELLTESGLIACMDRNQIGTDATIHEHIQKVLERRYVIEIKGKKLVPSFLGLKLAEFYDTFADMTSLTKPQLRASFEKMLNSIVEGSTPHSRITSTYLDLYQQVYHAVRGCFDRFVQDLQAVSSTRPIQSRTISESETVVARCNCGLIPRKASARTERNMGREFYSCVRESNRCDYFQWA